jgi:2-dehydropantoate 2-reductase
MRTMSETNSPASPTVAVVGPGAIGTTVAAALHRDGRTPLLCGQTPRDGLELRVGDESIAVPGPVRTDPGSVAEPVDLVLLAVKTTQLEGAAAWLRALCGPDTVVAVLQNGVEQVAQVSPLVPGSTVLPSVVWFPAAAQEDGSVWLRGDARLSLPDLPGADLVARAFAGTLCTVDLHEDFTTVAWRKLVQNAMAGLMALSGRRAGMYRRADVAGLARAYVIECIAVARAEGAVIDDAVADEIVRKFAEFPTDMGTSILADRDAGRPLEWDIRNGVVRRLGLAHGIPTPISDVVVPLLAAVSDGPG